MWELSYVNLVTWMWLKIKTFPILVHKLNECVKVVKITMVQILGLVEDERTFNNLFFMKSGYIIS
jgi:hypothetical protein